MSSDKALKQGALKARQCLDLKKTKQKQNRQKTPYRCNVFDKDKMKIFYKDKLD